MSPSFALSLCLVAVCVDADVSRTVVTFTRTPRCPGSDDLVHLHRIQGVLDLRTCIVECSMNDTCALVHFRLTESACFSATHQQASERCNHTVSSDNNKCESHERHENTTESQDNSQESTTQSSAASSSTGLSVSLSSKLLVFFDFRRSLDNLASPGRFTATLKGDATRDETGAHFPGNATSFIEVDTDSGSLVTNHLTHNHNFSFFARYERRTWYAAAVHSFHDCSGSVAAWFGDLGGKLGVKHCFLGLTDYADKVEHMESDTEFMNQRNTLQLASIGAVFTGKDFHNFYFDRSDVTDMASQGDNCGTELNCLRLGSHKGDSSQYFTGRIICYVIATHALTQSEMQQLDDACT